MRRPTLLALALALACGDEATEPDASTTLRDVADRPVGEVALTLDAERTAVRLELDTLPAQQTVQILATHDVDCAAADGLDALALDEATSLGSYLVDARGRLVLEIPAERIDRPTDATVLIADTDDAPRVLACGRLDDGEAGIEPTRGPRRHGEGPQAIHAGDARPPAGAASR